MNIYESQAKQAAQNLDSMGLSAEASVLLRLEEENEQLRKLLEKEIARTARLSDRLVNLD